MGVLIGILIFYLICFIGAIGLIIWAICIRKAEKKREAEEHKNYDQW